MLVTCQKISPIACRGHRRAGASAKPLLKLGKRGFSVKKGGKGYASIKLNAKGLALLRQSKNGTLRVKVIVLIKTSTKTMKVSPGVITLKATKAFLTAKPKVVAPPPSRRRPVAGPPAATIPRSFPGSSIGRAFGC